MISPEVPKVGISFDNFGVNLWNFSNMNLQMFLHKKAYWTPGLVVVECLHHSNPRSNWKQFPLEGVIQI